MNQETGEQDSAQVIDVSSDQILQASEVSIKVGIVEKLNLAEMPFPRCTNWRFSIRRWFLSAN